MSSEARAASVETPTRQLKEKNYSITDLSAWGNEDINKVQGTYGVSSHFFITVFFFLSLSLHRSRPSCLHRLVSKVTYHSLRRTEAPRPSTPDQLSCSLGHTTSPVPMTTRLRPVHECINELGQRREKKREPKRGREVGITCRSQKPLDWCSAAPVSQVDLRRLG